MSLFILQKRILLAFFAIFLALIGPLSYAEDDDPIPPLDPNNDFPFIISFKKHELTPPYLIEHWFKNNPSQTFKRFNEGQFTFKILIEDWDVGRKIIRVDQAKKKILSSFSQMLPQLNISINPQAPLTPIDLGKAFAGFFGFLVPSNWFKLFANLHLAEAERLSYIDLLLEKYAVGHAHFFLVQRLKWDYAILMTMHTKLTEHIEKNKSWQSPVVKPYLATLMGRIDEHKLNLQRELLDLALDANLAQDIDILNSFDITPVELPKLREKKPIGKDQLDHYTNKALAASLNLEVIRQTIRSVPHSTLAILTDGISVDDDKNLGISLGLENLVEAYIEKRNIAVLQQTLDEAKSVLRRDVAKAIRDYNTALQMYDDCERAIAITIHDLETNSPTVLIFVGNIERLTENYRRKNLAIHTFLIAELRLRRFLVLPVLSEIEKVMERVNDYAVERKDLKHAQYVSNLLQKRKS